MKNIYLIYLFYLLLRRAFGSKRGNLYILSIGEAGKRTYLFNLQ